MSTLTSIRQYIGRELTGGEVAFSADASGHTTTKLVDTDRSYVTQSTDMFVDNFLFVPAAAAANKLRVITAFAYSTGTFTVAPDVSSSSIYNSAAYEIWPIDPLNDVPLLINEALKRMPLLVWFNFAPVADSYEQDLTAQQSWLVNRNNVRAVYSLSSTDVQQQTITEAGSPSGGTFTLTYRGTTTSAIAYDATAATVQTAVRLLPDLSAVTVTRTGSSMNFVWVVTMTGADTYVPVFTASAASLTGGSSPSITPSITRQRGNLQLVSGTAEQHGDKVMLQSAREFETTDRLYVATMKMAYDHCATTSGFFGGQAGLSVESDRCVPDEMWVAFGALTVLARRETNTITRAADSAYAIQGPRWAATFKKLTQERWETARDGELKLRPVYSFGPGGGGNLANRSQRYRNGYL